MTDSSKFAAHKARLERRPDGALLMTSGYDLPEAVANTGVWLHKWAKATPVR
jgi:feruloyl-CoA synthase